MIRIRIILFFVLTFAVAVSASAQNVKVAADKSKQRIDITVDGKLFTSYRYEENIRRPALVPIMTASGNFITRGFPIETRNGETVGHPHQVGSSLSFGDVNGIDFWNNSPYRTAAELAHMGRIVHRKVLSSKSGKGKAELVTESEWVGPDGKAILLETTKYIFRADGKNRTIDRETRLMALNGPVTFGDNKEGFFAVHLARELQQDNQTDVKITDEKGNLTDSKSKENLSGNYLNSKGLRGDSIWGTLGSWASVSGRIGGEAVSVTVFDHPKNINYPSYMMVRGYGLLALNPFGRKIFDSKLESRKFVLEAGTSVTFRYRLLVTSGVAVAEFLSREHDKFIR